MRTPEYPTCTSASTTASSLSSASRFKSFRKTGAHIAGINEENDDINDEEDLEQEANAEGLEILPEDEAEFEEDDGGNIPDDDGGMVFDAASEREVYEAFAAGWKAKAKTAGARKARGWSMGGSNGSSSSSAKSLADKKRISTCSSCGQRGHWRGDSQCPNVLSGKDPPHKKPEASSTRRSTLRTSRSWLALGTRAICLLLRVPLASSLSL